MATIYEKYGKQLYSFLFQQLQSEELASTALKNTFSITWQAASDYNRAPEHFFIWLLRIAKQAADEVQSIRDNSRY